MICSLGGGVDSRTAYARQLWTDDRCLAVDSMTCLDFPGDFPEYDLEISPNMRRPRRRAATSRFCQSEFYCRADLSGNRLSGALVRTTLRSPKCRQKGMS